MYLPLCIVLCTALFFPSSECYNLSPHASFLFADPDKGAEGARDSYFGYSVGLRGRRQHNDNWLMVGAPRANLTPNSNAPVGLKEPGSMYKCPIGVPGGRCQQIVLDTKGNTNQNMDNSELAYKDLKDYGWVGGAMDTQPGDRESTMVCGPLWKNQYYTNNYLVNGVCYVQDSELEDATALKRLPLTKYSLQNYRISDKRSTVFFHYAHGEVGMSVHFTEKENIALLGAPGIFNWHGSVVQIRDPPKLPSGNISRRKKRQLLHPLQYYSSAFTPNPYFTSSLGDNYYFGYSVSSGTFKEGEMHYVAGAPRGANSTGKVLVFQMGQIEESELIILIERNGEQVGEYFGASVTAVDFNNDGLTELVVGAPMKSHTTVPDHGMVYVYANMGSGQINVEAERLDGSMAPGARFGSTVMSPGDLDNDGYKDLLVGAPYEGPGCVYVYLGSRDGIQSRFSQRISAETFTELSGTNLMGFGYSISRGEDVDDNQYPDVAIGSYASGHAVVLRTRPVAVLEGTTSTTPTRLTIYDTGFIINACVVYKGLGVPQREEVTVVLTLDHERELAVPRATFTETGLGQIVYNVTLRRGNRKCDQHRVNMQSEFSNAQTPVGVRIQYWLADNSLEEKERTAFEGGVSVNSKIEPIGSPVTDPSKRRGVSTFINIVTGCEEDKDDSCRSDLKITAWYPGYGGNTRLMIGEKKRIKLVVKVVNEGEPAFLPNITFAVNRPLDLLLPPTHTCERLSTDYPAVSCRLINPLVKGNTDKIEIEVDVEQLTDSSDPVTVNVTAGSSDIEVTPLDNFYNTPLQLQADVQLQLHGTSTEEQVTYQRSTTNTLNTTVTDIISFIHTHTLVKRGSTPVNDITLSIKIPVRDEHDHTLLTIHAPERDFRGQIFSCSLEGAEWVTVQKGEGVDVDGLQNEDTNNDGNRNKRQTASSDAIEVSDAQIDREAVPLVSCGAVKSLKCATMSCTINSWPQDSASATLSFRLDMNVTTLADIISIKDGTTLATDSIATIQSLGSLVHYDGNTITIGTAHTTILPGNLPHEGISWWWYILAILVGLLLLSGLIYGLYKMGFFVRKEQEEMKAMTATVSSGEDNVGSG